MVFEIPQTNKLPDENRRERIGKLHPQRGFADFIEIGKMPRVFHDIASWQRHTHAQA